MSQGQEKHIPDSGGNRVHPRLASLLQAPGALSHLFDAIPTPALITRASDGAVLAVNRALEEATGYTASAVLGRSVLELKWWPNEKARNRFLVELDRRGEIHDYSTQVLDAHGRLRHALLGAEVVELGGERLIVAVVVDLTPIVEARRRVSAEQKQQGLVFQEASEGIFLADEKGNLLEVNPAGTALLGYSREEMLGKSLDTFVPPEELGQEPQIASQLSAETESHVLQRRLRRKDSSDLTIEINARKLSDGRIAGIFRDVTQRAALEAQILEAQKLEAIGRLAGGIAHDFNNILTVIMTSAQLLIEGLDDESLKQDAQDILDAANRAASLTRQLLAFSRRQAVQPEILNPNEALRNTEKLIRRVIGEEIELSLELNSSGHIYIDPGQLDQAIMNLVVNARDAMPGGGRLTVSTSDVAVSSPQLRRLGIPEGDYVLVAVKDTGVGMSRDILKHIFEPFFTTKPAGQGTGLGLSTVYGIVSQNGGHVRVESEPGKGSTFYIYLPRTEPEEERAETAPEAEGEREPVVPGEETIVVVEDDPGVLGTVTTVLRRLGYRILAFGSPREALENLKRDRPKVDLLLSDVVMPGMRGPQLYRQVAELYPDLPVLYLSGYPGDPRTAEPLLPRDVPFIAKPFHPDALAKAVRGILERRPKTGT